RFADFDLDPLGAILEDLRDESQLAEALTATCGLRLWRAFEENKEQ
ncbi:MAG: hypothetical protein GY953_16470, partial [bacterium]|nr:hypothetical protein [bacterium]